MIAELDPGITFETAEAIARAEAPQSPSSTARIRSPGWRPSGPLLLPRTIASSRIEGYDSSQRNLARALIDPLPRRPVLLEKLARRIG